MRIPVAIAVPPFGGGDEPTIIGPATVGIASGGPGPGFSSGVVTSAAGSVMPTTRSLGTGNSTQGNTTVLARRTASLPAPIFLLLAAAALYLVAKEV